jgi:copper resistance protein B
MSGTRPLAAGLCSIAILVGACCVASAQTATAQSTVRLSPDMNDGGMPPPVMDNPIITHALLDQAEGRWNGRNEQFRYDGQLWSGTDLNKIWLKSEGLVTSQGKLTDGQNEFLLDHAISSYFDVQGGVRVDLRMTCVLCLVCGPGSDAPYEEGGPAKWRGPGMTRATTAPEVTALAL